jgi:hypothetical protein
MRTIAPIVTCSWYYMLEQLLIPMGLLLSPVLLFNVPLWWGMMFALLTLHLWNWDRNFRGKK